MAILDIVLFPDPVLREKCELVAEVTPEIRTLLDNMAETMYQAPGIGLAAPQVGATQRAIVVDVGDEPETGKVGRLYKIINPEIVAEEGKVQSEEGCLSIPDIRETVTRSEKISVEGLDENGAPLTIEADGMLSICLQHEIDHLNGILFIDYLSRLKRDLIKSRLKKIARMREE